MTGLSVSVREPGVRHGAQRGHRGRGPGGGVVRVSNPTGGEVATHVQASPDVVYGLVSDVRRMGEWSPETYWCEWTGGATGAEVGARFRACNRRGLLRWRNTPEVITATPGTMGRPTERTLRAAHAPHGQPWGGRTCCVIVHDLTATPGSSPRCRCGGSACRSLHR